MQLGIRLRLELGKSVNRWDSLSEKHRSLANYEVRSLAEHMLTFVDIIGRKRGDGNGAVLRVRNGQDL